MLSKTRVGGLLFAMVFRFVFVFGESEDTCVGEMQGLLNCANGNL
jgi:hypothetical protein